MTCALHAYFALAILLAPCSWRRCTQPMVNWFSVSVNRTPPPLPVYDQPPIHCSGYLWSTGILGVERRRWLLLGAGHLDITAQGWVRLDAGILGAEERRLRHGCGGRISDFMAGWITGLAMIGEGGYWKDGRFFYNSAVNNIRVSRC